MAAHSMRQGQPTGQEHGRPVDSVEAQDVLAYDVGGGPPLLLQVLCCRFHPLWQ